MMHIDILRQNYQLDRKKMQMDRDRQMAFQLDIYTYVILMMIYPAVRDYNCIIILFTKLDCLLCESLIFVECYLVLR